MLTFTIDRKDRDFRTPKLNLAEASQMASLGTVPYRIADDRQRNTLIFMQEPAA